MLSYFSFITFRPQFKRQVSQEIKGSSIENSFSFIPLIEGAEEISANYSSEGFERSFSIVGSCTGSEQRFYNNLLENYGWTHEKTEVEKNFEGHTYRKATRKIKVNSFNQTQSGNCIITLVGFSSY
jgi:hypothetical protein